MARTITGIDMSPSFAAASLIPERASELAPIPWKIKDIAKAGVKALHDRTESSMWNFATQTSPNTFQGLLERGMAGDNPGIVPDPKNQLKGKVKRTNAGWNARYLAMRDIDESKERTKMFKEKQDERLRTERKRLLVERAVDAIKDCKPIDKYAKEAAEKGMDNRQFMQAINDILEGRVTTEEERFTGIPPRSLNQYYKYKYLQRYAK